MFKGNGLSAARDWLCNSWIWQRLYSYGFYTTVRSAADAVHLFGQISEVSCIYHHIESLHLAECSCEKTTATRLLLVLNAWWRDLWEHVWPMQFFFRGNFNLLPQEYKTSELYPVFQWHPGHSHSFVKSFFMRFSGCVISASHFPVRARKLLEDLADRRAVNRNWPYAHWNCCRFSRFLTLVATF